MILLICPIFPLSTAITRKIRNNDILLINCHPIHSNAAVFPILCVGVLPSFRQNHTLADWVVHVTVQESRILARAEASMAIHFLPDWTNVARILGSLG